VTVEIDYRNTGSEPVLAEGESLMSVTLDDQGGP
jgi:hypothetical protein